MKSKLFLGVAIFLLALVAGILSVKSNVLASVSVCTSTGAQCGTDNGTKPETVTTPFSATCDTGYTYQNNGEWAQRCHRDASCGRWDWWNCPPEHKAPKSVSCPVGYVKSGVDQNTVCSKVEQVACHTGVIDYSSCTPAGECPKTCGFEGGTVPDGKGGTISCDPTDRCVNDVCSNLEGDQETLPDGYHFETVDEEQVCVKDAETPVPQPEPQPQGLTQAGAPVCSDGNILSLPIAFQVLRQGEMATLTWFKTGGDLVNIYYKELGQANWTHAVGDVPNVDPSNKFVIHNLIPSVGYIFAIEQHQGCAGGQMVQSVVVDGAVAKPVLFKFSYWVWSK